MTKILDSRSQEFGFLPLQDHGSGHFRDLANRISIIACRTRGRAIKSEGLGKFIEDRESYGDLIGGLFWPKNTRLIPSWAFAWPTKIVSASGQKKTDSGNTIPILNGKWDLDAGFGSLKPSMPMIGKRKLKLPGGIFGITLASTQSAHKPPQEELFFPAGGGPLIAVHQAGDPEYGSLVADLDDDNNIDDERLAVVQSMMRVVKEPVGISLTQPGLPVAVGSARILKLTEGENALAWNIGWSQQHDVIGGFIQDTPLSLLQNIAPILAMVSEWAGGPFRVGDVEDNMLGIGDDQHKLGVDEDEHAINSAHFQTETLFHSGEPAKAKINGQIVIPASDESIRCNIFGLHNLAKQSRPRLMQDAPLDFDKEIPYEKPTPKPGFPIPVFLRHDPCSNHPWVVNENGEVVERQGLWRWETFLNEYIDTSCGLGQKWIEDNLPQMSAWNFEDGQKPYSYHPMDAAFTGILGRPAWIGDGAKDFRNYIGNEDFHMELDKSTPIVGRIEAWGKQDADADTWDAQGDDGSSPWCAGYACGGFALMPPNRDMSDYADPTDPPEVVSGCGTFFNVAPGTSFSAGLPDISTGEIAKGFSWGVDENGCLVYYRYEQKTIVFRGTIQCDDVHGERNNPTTNYASSTTLPAAYDDSGLSKTFLLKWPGLTSIPTNATIISAIQTETLSTSLDPDKSIVRTHKINSSWDESTVTWNTGPSYGPGIIDQQPPPGAVAGKVTHDLKTLVQGWVSNPSTNFGIAHVLLPKDYETYPVFPLDQPDAVAIHSSEAANEDNRPKLTVIYTLPKKESFDLCDGVFTMDDSFASPWLTLAPLSADVNDYAIGTGQNFEISATTSGVAITGIVAGVDGQEITLWNTGAQAIEIPNQDAGSVAANRIVTGTGASIFLAQDDPITLIYRAGSINRWRATA